MDYKTVLTTCAYCGCGCGLCLEVLDGRLIGTLPSKTKPHKRGQVVCEGLEHSRVRPASRPAHQAADSQERHPH